jgi:hypothetical protein
MTQALYAHMNNKTIKINKKKTTQHSNLLENLSNNAIAQCLCLLHLVTGLASSGCLKIFPYI